VEAARPKGPRWGGVLGEEAASSLPSTTGLGEHCKLLQWVRGESPAEIMI